MLLNLITEVLLIRILAFPNSFQELLVFWQGDSDTLPLVLVSRHGAVDGFPLAFIIRFFFRSKTGYSSRGSGCSRRTTLRLLLGALLRRDRRIGTAVKTVIIQNVVGAAFAVKSELFYALIES